MIDLIDYDFSQLSHVEYMLNTLFTQSRCYQLLACLFNALWLPHDPHGALGRLPVVLVSSVGGRIASSGSDGMHADIVTAAQRAFEWSWALRPGRRQSLVPSLLSPIRETHGYSL
jgi:hypothetical protein